MEMEIHPDTYRISVFFHIFAFAFWFGGMLFLVAVIRPVLKRNETPQKYGFLIERFGRIFSRITWFFLFPVFIITGFLNAYVRTGELHPGSWLGTSHGKLIFIKFHLFFLILLFSALHDFWFGPKATRLLQEKGDAGTWGKLAGWVGRLNFILGVIMLSLGLGVVRGC